MTVHPGGRAAVASKAAGFAAAVAVLACGMGLGHRARAQVLEIGDGGKVTVYDRPMVFNDQGATPIQTHTAQTRTPQTRRAGPYRAGLSTADIARSRLALAGAAQTAGLSADLIEAVARQESGFRPRVVSSAGAVGEMQLMPATARGLGVDPYDTVQNYRGGSAYLGGLLRRYDGDLIRALAAYNAGPGAVDRYGGIPPFRETRDYVAAVLERLSQKAVLPYVAEKPR